MGDRSVVKKVSKQWVLDNCSNVTERDMGLLKLLESRRLLRRDHIEILYPEFPSTDYLNKRLQILYKRHIIDRVYPKVGLGKGSSKQHVCLDRAGTIILNSVNYRKPIVTDTEGNKSLLLGWRHIIRINDYECSIHQYSKSRGLRILMYDAEKELPYYNTKIIPDIFLFTQSGNKGNLFFIEVDLGTEDLPYIKKKIQSYVEYYMSKNWIREEWARVFKRPTFPRIVFLTEEGRTQRVNRIREITKDYSIKFHVGFHSQLEEILDEIQKE